MEFATDGLLELPNPIQSVYSATSLRLNVVENGIVKRLSNLPAFLFDVVEVGSEYWLLMADYFNDSSSLRVVAMNRSGQSIDTFGYNGVLVAISDSFRSRTYYDATSDGSGGVILLADDNFHLNLIRIDSDGLDRNFGRLGYAVTPIASPSRTYPLQHAQIRNSCNRFVIAATVGGPNASTEISVLDRQGNLVTGFGTSGKVKLDPSIFKVAELACSCCLNRFRWYSYSMANDRVRVPLR